MRLCRVVSANSVGTNLIPIKLRPTPPAFADSRNTCEGQHTDSDSTSSDLRKSNLRTLAIAVVQELNLLTYKGVTRVLQECYKSVTRVLQECCKRVNVIFVGVVIVFLRNGALQECYMGPIRVLQECYKSGTRRLRE
jgi:hypothetical protein